MENVFFIIGCPRSGTTAVAKILNIANNADVYVEQEPKKELCIGARKLYKNELVNPDNFIKILRNESISKTISMGKIYGDKNPNYLNFIPFLLKIWNAKFVFIIRNGYEVVRSSLGSYKYWRGNYFALEEDGEVSKLNSPEDDWWDYSRLRPNTDNPYYADWKSMSKFEKCCWHWNEFNKNILNFIYTIPPQIHRTIDINKFKAKDYEEIFNFLGLEGYDQQKIRDMLDKKINSLKEKAGIEHDYPHWNFWSTKDKEIFNKHCRDMMTALGYI
jgi:hypothetical protein